MLEILIEGAGLIEIDSEMAIKKMKMGLTYMPSLGEGWYNLGLCYHHRKSIRKAIRAYKLAMDCKNANENKKQLGTRPSSSGNYEEGWDMYEERMNNEGGPYQYSKIYGKPWQGKYETRKYKKLIIVGEQGLGIQYNFVTYTCHSAVRNRCKVLLPRSLSTTTKNTIRY